MTRATTFRATAVIGGVLLAILMIMTVSRAAFSDTTDNTGNSWASGVVSLTDNYTEDVNLAEMFDEDPIAPGDTDSACIEIIYTGSPPPCLPHSSISTAGSTGLAPALDMEIERYSGACKGESGSSLEESDVFTGTLAAANSATFLDTWAAATVGARQFYEITWTFNNGAGNSYQDTTAQAAFTWQATSN